MYKLSPSLINLMLECPKCFWLHLVKNIKRPDIPFPSLPVGMDKILKEHFDRFIEKNQLPPELKEQHSMNNYSLFKNKKLLKIWRDNFKGIQYKDKQSGIILHGALDNILIKNNKLIILDYKTRGYPPKEETHKHYQVQMDLYNFLLRKNNYNTEDYAYLLFYYPNKVLETGEVIFDTKLIKIKTNIQNGERIFKQAINLLNLKNPPKPSKTCNFCSWLNHIQNFINS